MQLMLKHYTHDRAHWVDITPTLINRLKLKKIQFQSSWYQTSLVAVGLVEYGVKITFFLLYLDQKVGGGKCPTSPSPLHKPPLIRLDVQFFKIWQKCQVYKPVYFVCCLFVENKILIEKDLVLHEIHLTEKQVLHLKEKRWVLVLNNYLARLNTLSLSGNR